MKHLAPYVLLVALALAAVFMNSWPAVVILGLLGPGAIVLFVMERIYPEHTPDPTGAELLVEFVNHRAEVKADLERMQSLLSMAQSRAPRLRE